MNRQTEIGTLVLVVISGIGLRFNLDFIFGRMEVAKPISFGEAVRLQAVCTAALLIGYLCTVLVCVLLPGFARLWQKTRSNHRSRSREGGRR